jgi:hypothetical protein
MPHGFPCGHLVRSLEKTAFSVWLLASVSHRVAMLDQTPDGNYLRIWNKLL